MSQLPRGFLLPGRVDRLLAVSHGYVEPKRRCFLLSLQRGNILAGGYLHKLSCRVDLFQGRVVVLAVSSGHFLQLWRPVMLSVRGRHVCGDGSGLCELSCGKLFCVWVKWLHAVSRRHVLVRRVAVLSAMLSLDVFACRVQLVVLHQLRLQLVHEWSRAVRAI